MTLRTIRGAVAVHRLVAEETVLDARTKFERVAASLENEVASSPHIYRFCNDSAFIGSIC